MSKRWLSIGGVTFFLVAVFCVGFVVFYYRIQRTQILPVELPDTSKSLINKPLPRAQLIDLNGSRIDEQILRRGKVILVFVTTDCDACRHGEQISANNPRQDEPMSVSTG